VVFSIGAESSCDSNSGKPVPTSIDDEYLDVFSRVSGGQTMPLLELTMKLNLCLEVLAAKTAALYNTSEIRQGSIGTEGQDGVT